MTIPRWLQTHLEACGRWDADGIRRAVSAAVCPTCKTRVLTGLDDDRCAGPATADPTPLDATGEALALLAGRSTYDLTRRGDRYELDLRDPIRIRHRPAGSPGADVVPAHRCHAASLPAVASVHAPRPIAAQGCTDEPPF